MEALPRTKKAELPTDDALDLLARSSTAAFAIDRNDRVIYWNKGAEQMLGWGGSDVLGHFCFEVLQGRDPFGNLYCSADCPIMRGAVAGTVAEPFMIRVKSKAKGLQTVRVRTVPLPGAGDDFRCLIHLLDRGDAREIEKLVEELQTAAAHGHATPVQPDPVISVSPLTVREREIMALLSNGYAALNIAARLNLSHATVRNHIQNILRKLEVHSQVEAISVAFRRGWI